MDNEQLKDNTTDWFVGIIKGFTSMVPPEYGGTFLTEFLPMAIPNQRLDRVVKFVLKMEEKMSLIPFDKLVPFFNNPQYSDIFEEGILQSSRSLSDERREYISNIIFNGLSKEKIDLEQTKFLLTVINQLTDSEIIWLKSYSLYSNFAESNAFKDQHHNILALKYTMTTSTEDELVGVALQRKQNETLDRLELVSYEFVFDAKGIQQMESGFPKKQNRKITRFGQLLLKNIGIETTPDY